jgi:hypothetical protein
MFTKKQMISLSIALFGIILVTIIFPRSVNAERNTQAVCRYRLAASGLNTLPDGRRYTVFEYSVKGNDNARRVWTGPPLNRWWTENGWYVNSAGALGSPACSADDATTAPFWNGSTVNLGSPQHAWVFGGGRPDSIYMGLPNGASFIPQDNYNIPGVGNADNGARALLGIDKVPLDVFASINDGGVAQVGPSTAWCLGMNTLPHFCGNVDSGNIYPGGGDFAGYQNGGNFAARNNLIGAFRTRVENKQPINDLIGYNPNTSTSFNVILAGSNTRDTVPPALALQCLNNVPGQAPCNPTFADGNPIPEPFINNKSSVVLTYVFNPPELNLNAVGSCAGGNDIVISGNTETNNGVTPTVEVRIRNNADNGWILLSPNPSVDASGDFSITVPSEYKDAHSRAVQVTSFGAGGTTKVVNTGIPPCIQPTCTVATDPGNPEVAQQFRLTLSWQYNPGSSGRGIDPSNAYSLFQGTPQNVNPPYYLNGGSVIFPQQFSLPTSGSYAVTGRLTYTDVGFPPNIINIDCNNGGSPPTITVATKPYFRIYGNDAMAGGYFADAASPTECTGGPVDSLATFQGFNAAGDGGGANPTGNYLRGAGSQHALFALGQINSVASSANRNFLANATNLGGNTRWPTRQTFANYGTTNYSPNFGGSGGISRCIPDFYSRSSSVAKTTGVYNLNVGGDNNPRHASPVLNQLVNINGADITVPGLNQTVYIDGDAKIADGANIIYNDSVLDGFNDVPNLTIVVKGDLYIDDDTTRLDGTYIVQPYWDGSTWKGGRLITCYESAGAGRPFNNNELPTNCNKKLEINGAVISQEIILLRTNGNYSSNPDNPTNPGGILNNVETPRSNNIAEVFNFSPEIYLNPANFTTSSSTGKYDAINVLPPTF